MKHMMFAIVIGVFLGSGCAPKMSQWVSIGDELPYNGLKIYNYGEQEAMVDIWIHSYPRLSIDHIVECFQTFHIMETDESRQIPENVTVIDLSDFRTHILVKIPGNSIFMERCEEILRITSMRSEENLEYMIY